MNALFTIIFSLAVFVILLRSGYLLGLRMPLRPHLATYIFKHYRRMLIDTLIVLTMLLLMFALGAVTQFFVGQFMPISIAVGVFWTYGFTFGFGYGFDDHYELKIKSGRF